MVNIYHILSVQSPSFGWVGHLHTLAIALGATEMRWIHRDQ